ncbi:Ferredoxin subunit of nitrite reductase or a ring-hydroxylating dioxygenase [Sphingomonas guangdongensis]|uniref:Ferredoxin subunit of nitrite reductase or a ring-hydroxylating dioxygenase n=1 Tax=Sphingomonas guangdongensis TaxID=1141890 RepID=A0A285QEP7_9SPHN|nr:Rieske (2Fe-2S) protein [Sphingomonas guangdongensis]SOB78607.1 Ferredoxin subunit of nitrite reductase or a ring-hydroxylating dioxygenase [Sphingomonas guangdongensis]
MTGIERLFATPPGVRLGPLDQIPDGTARNYVLQLRAGRFHGFVVRQGGVVTGYVDRCPHAGVPLAARLDDYLSPDGTLIVCSWHGAVFRIADGLCLGGPCTGASLTPWPVTVAEGEIITCTKITAGTESG